LVSAVAACQEIAQRPQGDTKPTVADATAFWPSQRARQAQQEPQTPLDAGLPGDCALTAMLSVIMEHNIGINRRTRKCR
jgi:hypothetical protein